MMSVVKRTFSLPDEISVMLDESIPNQARSKFIALLISDALKKKKTTSLLEAIDNIQPKKNNGASVVDIIRKIRQAN